MRAFLALLLLTSAPSLECERLQTLFEEYKEGDAIPPELLVFVMGYLKNPEKYGNLKSVVKRLKVETVQKGREGKITLPDGCELNYTKEKFDMYVRIISKFALKQMLKNSLKRL